MRDEAPGYDKHHISDIPADMRGYIAGGLVQEMRSY